MRTADAGKGARWGVTAAVLAFVLALAPLSAQAQAALSEAAAASGEPAAVRDGQPAPPGPSASPEQQGPDSPAAGLGSGEQREPSLALPQDGALSTVPTGTGAPGNAPLASTPTGTGGPADANNFVDTLHGGISSGFLSTATWLDSFFGNERYEAEINRSQLKIRFDAFREGGSGVDYRQPNFNLRLVLPQLRKRTRLVISGDPKLEADANTVQPGASPAGTVKPNDKNITSSLQYVPVETLKTNFSIRAGVRLHSGKFEVLAGPRYRYLIPLDPWALRFTEEFIWSSDTRWQSRTRFDLERPLPSGLFFRSSLEGIWSENVVGYPYALSFIVVQPLDGNRAVQYEWVNSFQTQPTDVLVEELLVFRYRQRFWRKWLFLEIAPQYRFPRDRSFEAQPGILFRLEMVFGNIAGLF